VKAIAIELPPRCDPESVQFLRPMARASWRILRYCYLSVRYQWWTLAKAKAAGVYKGRKQTIDIDEVRRLRGQERLGATEIAKRLGIARTSAYRVLREA
jgi:hypothetical protein